MWGGNIIKLYLSSILGKQCLFHKKKRMNIKRQQNNKQQKVAEGCKCEKKMLILKKNILKGIIL
jgi:hypothetical protein